MAKLYPMNVGGNDQNALAFHFFESGYLCWRLHAAATGSNPPKPDAAAAHALRDQLRQLTAYATVAQTPARLAADALSSAFEKACQQLDRNGAISASALELMIRTGRSATNGTAGNPADPARAWFMAGTMSAGCDLDAPGQPQQLRQTDLALVDALGPIIRCSQAAQLVQQARAQQSGLHAAITGWIRTHLTVLWEPARARGQKHRFNGRDLSEIEYRVMEAARVHGTGAQGLSSKELQDNVSASASNALTKLRSYPETKDFLSPNGPLRFVRPAPMPPEHE